MPLGSGGHLVVNPDAGYSQSSNAPFARRWEVFVMESNLVSLTYEIELQPGEKLSLPPALIESVGVGRWLITVQPLGKTLSSPPLRQHNAFLNSYAPEDEGLYDDYPAR